MAASNNWTDILKTAQKSCLIQDGKKKVHYTFKDGRQMVEEYDMNTCVLQVRKHMSKTALGDVGSWVFEIGQDLQQNNPASLELVENSANPICVRKNTLRTFEWRVRNLPYSLDTYIVTVDEDRHHIIVRTTNKKYFKKIVIEDMERLRLQLDSSSLSYAHANNTLIVTYTKPKEVLELEQSIRDELSKVKNTADGDVNMCPPS